MTNAVVSICSSICVLGYHPTAKPKTAHQSGTGTRAVNKALECVYVSVSIFAPFDQNTGEIWPMEVAPIEATTDA